MSSAATATLLNASFGSTAVGEAILKRLTRHAGFGADNVIARLAIARSLMEGGDPWSAEFEEDSSGKQIRGMTLLGRHDVATSLLAMIVEAHGGVESVDELRRLVRLHWERGLRLLDAELAAKDFESLLLEYLNDAGLSDDHEGSGSWAGDPERVLSQHVVGQPAVVASLARLLESNLSDAGIPLLRQPIVLVGPKGAGKGALATAIATQSHVPIVSISAPEITGSKELLRLIEDDLAQQGHLVETVGDARVQLPEYVLHVDSAELLSDQQISWIRALRPDGKWHDTGDARIRIPGGAVVLGSTRPLKLRGTETLHLAGYARDEIAEILRRELGGWPLEIRRLLGLVGRLNPGRTVGRARAFASYVQEKSTSGRPSETLLFQLMNDEWHVDRLGLAASDYELLDSIASGADVALDTETRQFFSKLGLIDDSDGPRITSRGRSAIDIQRGVAS